MVSPEDYPRLLQTAVSIAEKAAPLIVDAFHSRSRQSDSLAAAADIKVATKGGNPVDLVTATDMAVEQLIFSELRSNFPDHAFVGEETMAQSTDSSCGLSDRPTWIVDPIDGTTNFVHGLPFVAICIGLTVNKTAVLGVVFNPILGDLYTGIAGQGSFWNGKQLPLFDPPRPLESLAEALVISEYGSDRSASVLSSKVETIHRIMAAPSRGFRSFGSAAINMCFVARGSCDLYWEAGIHIWDICAASVIVREAGGAVLNWTRQDAQPSAPSRLAGCSPQVLQEQFDPLARSVLVVRCMGDSNQGLDALVESVRGRLGPLPEMSRD